MSFDDFKKEMNWKDMIQILGIGIIIGGGWYKLGEIEKDVGNFASEQKEFDSRLTETENTIRDRRGDIAKIPMLNDKIDATEKNLAGRMGNIEERQNAIREDVSSDRERIVSLERDSGDRIKRTPLERWMLLFERANNEKGIVVPAIPN